MSDIQFVDGFIPKLPHPNAPDFVKLRASIKRTDMIEWLKAQNADWVNLDIKEAKNGKLYAAVDTWVPKQPAMQTQGSTNQDDFDDDIPF
jgi:hypothetical protein